MNEILEILKAWTNFSVVGGSLIIGYILKNYVDMDNKHIPLIMAATGVMISLGLNGYVSVEKTILAGALSGLASTGLHQVFHQYIKPDYKEHKLEE